MSLLHYTMTQEDVEDMFRENLFSKDFLNDYFCSYADEFNIDFIREIKDKINWNGVFIRICGGDILQETKEYVINKYHPVLKEFWRDYELQQK